MSLHTSSKLGFILINFLFCTSLAQLISGKPGKIRPGFRKPGKIRPGIVPDERKGTVSKNEDKPQTEITSIEGSYIIHLAPPGSNSCDYGETVPKYECEAAGSILSPNPGRTLQVGHGGTCLDGSWGQVPFGCSVQSAGDRAAHYKTSGDTGPGCIHPHYQLVCRTKDVAKISGCEMQNSGWMVATIVAILFLLLLFIFIALISIYIFRKSWLPNLVLAKINILNNKISIQNTSPRQDEKSMKTEDIEIGGTSDNVEVAQSLIVRKTTQQDSKTFSEML